MIRITSLKSLSLFAALIVGITSVGSTIAYGGRNPGYSCEGSLDPGAQVVCGDDQLSQASLELSQAYYAVRGATDPSQWPGYKQMAVQFLRNQQNTCGVTSNRAVPSDRLGAVRSCMLVDIQRQRLFWVNELRRQQKVDAIEEATRSPSENIKLQQSLKQQGWLPSEATIDGVFGEGTRTAIRNFQASRSLRSDGLLSDATALALISVEIYSAGSKVIGARTAAPVSHPLNRSIQNSAISDGLIVTTSVEVPTEPELGSTFKLFWKISGKLPVKSKNGLERIVNGSRRELIVVSLPEQVRLRGKGFIVIPPGSNMPFGMNDDPGRLRVVFPLYVPESQDDGTLQITAYQAGPFDIKVKLLKSHAGPTNREVVDISNVSVNLIEQGPVVVVQDRVENAPPLKIWNTPEDYNRLIKYRIKEYLDEFHVLLESTGGQIVSVGGRNPSSSSRGRFIQYRASQNLKIYDLVARKEVFSASDVTDILSGFTSDDGRFFVSKQKYGAFYTFSPYIDYEHIEMSDMWKYSKGGHYQTNHPSNFRVNLEAMSYKVGLGDAGEFEEPTVGSLIRPDLEFKLRPNHTMSDYANFMSLLNSGPHYFQSPIWYSDIGKALPGSTINIRFAESEIQFLKSEYPIYTNNASRNVVKMTQLANDNTSRPSSTIAADHAGRRGLAITPNRSPRYASAESLSLFLRELYEYDNLGSASSPIRLTSILSTLRTQQSTNIRGQKFEFQTVAPPEVDYDRIVRAISAYDVVSANLVRSIIFSQNLDGRKLLRTRSDSESGDWFPRVAAIWHFESGQTRALLVRIINIIGGSDGNFMNGWCLFSNQSQKLFPTDEYCRFDIPVLDSDFTNEDHPILSSKATTEKHAVVLYPMAFSSQGSLVAWANRIPGQIWIAKISESFKNAWKLDVDESANLESLNFSADGKMLLQNNSDGRFFLYSVESRRVILSGTAIDDEFIAYDKNGYYAATLEGAHYVYQYFRGQGEHYPFAQFESVLHRPDIIKAQLRGEAPPPRPVLTAPPVSGISMTATTPDATGLVHFKATASSQTQLAKVRIFVDGIAVKEEAASGKSFASDVTVRVSQGRHSLTVVAYDDRGFSSAPQSVFIDGSNSPLAKSKLFYLGIAVDRYPGVPGNDLAYSKADAKLLADTIQRQYAKQYQSTNVTLLTDADVTQIRVIEEMNRIVALASNNDTIIVFVAGHGMQATNGDFLYLTSQARKEELSHGAIVWSQAADALSKSRAKVLVLLDACHSGAASADTVVPNDAFVADLTRKGKAGMVVIAASKGRQFSQERADLGGGHGIFTYAVAQALDAQRDKTALGTDGVVTLAALYDYVKRFVRDATKDSELKQTPWMSRNELVGDVPIL